MIGEGAVPRPGDLLLQAVEGMERPMFVLDAQWRFRYINPAGARVLDRTVEGLLGRDIWAEFPEAIGSPFEQTYRGVRTTGTPGFTEAWFGPLEKWFRADAFLTEAGLVVTYDDVTARRRSEQERAAAVQAREEAVTAAAAAAARAEEAGRHLMLLGDINLAMTSTPDADEAVDRFAHLVVPLLADWCLVTVTEGGARRDIGRAHHDPDLVAAMNHYADLRVATNLSAAPVPRVLRDPSPIVIQDLTPEVITGMVGSPEALAALEPLDVGALAAFPLSARGEIFGAVTLVNSRGRGRFTETELRTGEIAARRAALALDNARLAAVSHQVAERLQLSLLSPPVQPDHLELAVRYRPATEGVAIGGDWYDSFLQPDGATVLVIGDVMGHDIEAAAAMGQVKTLVRGIAFDRLEEPASVLTRADHALVGLAVPAMATALVCRIEQTAEDAALGRRRLRWSSAGHPAPMLLAPDGTVTDLAAPVGPPLGIAWRGRRSDGVTLMAPDSTLLLFTDGLFERRGVGLDEGRELVRDFVMRSSHLPLALLCDQLIEELVGASAEDDVAVLAVRAHPVDQPRPAEAGPEWVPAVV